MSPRAGSVVRHRSHSERRPQGTTKNIDADRAIQEIRLFQEVFERTMPGVASIEAPRRSGRDGWFPLLADISGLRLDVHPDPIVAPNGTRAPAFKLDPTPQLLRELAETIRELENEAELDRVDRLVLIVLRHIEGLLADEGLGPVYRAACSACGSE